MHGTTGGLNETKAALLASNGFATLALAFSRYQDLGKYLDIDVEYFEVCEYKQLTIAVSV